MIPAHQRFKAGDATARQIDLRLIGEKQLAFGERDAQLLLPLHQMVRAVRQLRRIELVAVLARVLRAVHGEVGFFQQVDLALVGDRVERDADARMQHERTTAHLERLGERVGRRFGERDSALLDVVALNNHDELVAADAAQRAAVANRGGEA